KIATTLNNERVANPNGQDRSNTSKRSNQWSVGGIKAILERELYRGRLVYGKTKNVWSAEGRSKAAGDKPVTVERPDLRTIPESLWTAAHARRASAQRQYTKSIGAGVYGKPGAGLIAKHVLSGLLQCGVCGGNLFISKKTGQRQREAQVMFCCSNRRAGRGLADGSPCTNVYGVPEPELTTAVLDGVKRVFLDP